MTLNEYQKAAMTTAVPQAKNLNYMVLGLTNEAGEVAGKQKKFFRGDYNNKQQLFLEHMRGEIGDVLWYLAGCCEQCGMSLEEVANDNIAKLASRKQRDAIRGDGDNR